MNDMMKHIIHDEYYEPCMDIQTFQLFTDKLSLRYNSWRDIDSSDDYHMV